MKVQKDWRGGKLFSEIIFHIMWNVSPDFERHYIQFSFHDFSYYFFILSTSFIHIF